MIRRCKHCSKEFKTYSRKQKYCNRDCYDIAHKSKKYPQKCETCGKGFIPNYPGRRFCSKKCRLEHGWTDSNPSKHSTFVCEWCKKEFETWTYRQPRFCSRKCAAHYGGSVGGRPRMPENYIMQKCAWCGKEYEASAHQVRLRNSRHCSLDCKYATLSIERMGEGNPNYNGGHIDNYGPNWHSQKRKAIRRDKHTCQVCGYKTGGNIILDVHHITPVKEFDGNWQEANKLTNLICLCRNCHAKVERGHIDCPKIKEV